MMDVLLSLFAFSCVILTIFVITPKVFDVRLTADAVVVLLLDRVILKRVPFSIVRHVSTTRSVTHYLPLPLFGMVWHDGGATCVNRAFRPHVHIHYREKLHASYLDKQLIVTPADTAAFIHELEQRVALPDRNNG